MRISDWSSDVCSSDLGPIFLVKIQSSQFIVCIIIIYKQALFAPLPLAGNRAHKLSTALYFNALGGPVLTFRPSREGCECDRNALQNRTHIGFKGTARRIRSEEHTSELQALMRNSYAVFCLNNKSNRYAKHTYPLRLLVL